MDRAEDAQDPDARRSRAPWLVGLAIGVFVAAGWLAYQGLAARPDPPPPEIAADPILVRGREIFLDRCASCHGPAGRGDGPLAKGLTGPPPRNLAQDPWKHGDRPEQVLAVIGEGAKDAQMPGWSGVYAAEDLRAVAAYVFQVAGKPVPGALRGP